MVYSLIMNKKIIIVLGVLSIMMLLVFFFFNKKKTTTVVNQGLYGKVTLYEGDCMPGMNKCQMSNVARMIYIRKPAGKEAMKDSYLKKKTELVEKVKSDKNGNYQVELPNGKYSVFVEDDKGEYINHFEQDGGAFVIEIKDNLVKYDIEIDHAAW